MSTTSTVPVVKAKLVALFTAGLATSSPDGGQVQVSYAWPGPDTQPESVFLGRHPGLSDPTEGISSTDGIATIKAGRKWRDQDYTVDVTIWSFQQAFTVTDAATAEARGFVLLGELEDVLADDPTLGLTAGTIRSCELSGLNVALVPFETGWASYIVAALDVKSRLT